METETSPQKGETAEKFKERIEETQREAKRLAKAAEKPVVPVVPAQVPPEATVVPPAVTEEKKPLVTGNAELDEWLAKKGPMTVENLAANYREAEREMYRKMEEARKAQGQPVTPPPAVPPANFPPFYNAPVAPGWAPPAYVPPQPPPPMNAEALAKQYQLSTEDFERVAPLIHDMTQAGINQALQRALPPLVNQVQTVNREVGRQKELVELMSDPAFKNPQVQFEMDRIFKEEPNTFVAQTQPIRYVYEKALTRIARANLGGSSGTAASMSSGEVPLQTKPPATAGGNGNGGGGAPSGTPQEVTEKSFAAMSMAEKISYLTAIGVRPRS